jgi:DnaK suppressor protein
LTRRGKVEPVNSIALEPGDADLLRDLLVGEQQRLRSQQAALDDTYRDLVDAADLEPPDDEHDPDGTTAYERAQIGSLRRASRIRLAEVDAALEGLDQGTYGACDRCGEPIPLGRLAAVLGTTRCINCASG